MILELDTKLFKKLKEYKLTISQVVFLILVFDENQTKNQDVTELISRVSDEEIQGLISFNLIEKGELNSKVVFSPTKQLLNLVADKTDRFDEFYQRFPIYVTRPDGSKAYLRTNLAKCKIEYRKTIGRSSAMHEHIMRCLSAELEEKAMTGKLGYVKGMWKWLVTKEWEAQEEKLKYDKPTTNVSYGSTIY
jgi:hypothetical protein